MGCATAPDTPVGLQADHIYRSQMSSWRFAMRSFLLATLKNEISVLEVIQRFCRSKTLDRVMVNSSWLGSHQFFILTLPLTFWVGDHRLARSQVYILAMSVYFTGALKDYFCIPRPYSPPIDRLSISNHAAEYGFPSTHSATSSAIALLGLQYALHHQYSGVYRICLLLAVGLYEFVLVFGRVYCGMHSMQDVICGGGIGVLSWSIYRIFGAHLEDWVTSSHPSGSGRILVPILLLLAGLVLTAAHPQPIEDCPCFEDSTAFVAVSVGVMTGHWIGHESIQSRANELQGRSIQLPAATIKLFLGLTALFAWRFVMKELLSRLLPPIFKLCAPLLELPRRHYATTKDYDRYRYELREHRRRTGLRARLIPSVVHLPKLSDTISNQHTHHGTPHHQRPDPLAHALHPALRDRNPDPGSKEIDPLLSTENKQPNTDPKCSTTTTTTTTGLSKRYDVDVLMRLIVYCGIGFLSRRALQSRVQDTVHVSEEHGGVTCN